MTQVLLEKTLQRLSLLYPKTIELSLDRIKSLLAKLGHPERKLPPILHVAGTNGKGSTLAFLRAILLAHQPESVHMYTSPHLVRYNERIQLQGKIISDQALISLLERIEAVNQQDPITFFEITTAAAFLAFSETPAKFVLLETGLGGRFDATNVIENPKACLLTSISLDHMKFLGQSLEEIAYEKAGILKAGCQAFTAQKERKVLEVLQRQAAHLQLPLRILDQDFQCYEQNQRLLYQEQDCLLDLPLPSLAGRFQYQNAGLAIACARFLGIETPAIREGIKTAIWPARLQRLKLGKRNPEKSGENVNTKTPKNPKKEIVSLRNLSEEKTLNLEIWLDGSHNPDGARVISEAMADFEDKISRPLVLIAGLLGNKDAKAWLSAFQGLAYRLIAIPVPGHTAIPPAELAALAEKQGMKGETAPDFLSALSRILKEGRQKPSSPATGFSPIRQKGSPSQSEAQKIKGTPEPKKHKSISEENSPRILITGSLYLAGHVLESLKLAPE